MSERVSNYDKQAESARKLFLEWDSGKLIDRFTLEHDERALYIPFFGRRHRIDRENGEVTCGEKPAGFNAVMTIYDALCWSKEDARPLGEWRSLVNLSPHSNFGGKDALSKTALAFSGRVRELKDVCERLGGRPATTADAGYEFDMFEFLPMRFQFWDGDEEFAPRIVHLFDVGTLDFIHFETAWYAAGYLEDMLLEEMGA